MTIVPKMSSERVQYSSPCGGADTTQVGLEPLQQLQGVLEPARVEAVVRRLHCQTFQAENLPLPLLVEFKGFQETL